MSLTIKVCPACAAGISSDDWTHLDQWCECPAGDGHLDDCEAELTHQAVQSTIEYYGWLTATGPGRSSSAFTCEMCSFIEYGLGDLFLVEKGAKEGQK